MLPQDFLERMEKMLGDGYPSFLGSYSEVPCHALCVNTLKTNLNLFLTKSPFSLSSVPWEPNGFSYGTEDAPGRHPYHAAGVYYIQEPSAMAPVTYLEPTPGERVLDLCAAPGGKSAQIASSMQGKGIFISNEIHPARAKILSENIERIGARNCMVTNETPEALAAVFTEYFDRILVDAPCSGEGMFRKNTLACGEWSLENVKLCAGRQLSILSCAASMLRPGGRMVYSTCTFAPEENEGTLSRFLRAHPEFSVIPVKRFPGMSAGAPDLVPEPACGVESGVRLYPHRLCGEGHFFAVLEKKGGPLSPRPCKNGMEKPVDEKDCRAYTEFCEATLKKRPAGTLIRFGGQLYLAPEELPSARGLRVLRPGLHLGTLLKNRFVPSHALALALRPEDVTHTHSLSSEGTGIRAYLNGQTLPADGEKGWYLITVDDYSIGWGKLAGGMMKNHYPKGLRQPC